MANTRNLVLLHSNDLHGSFHSQDIDEQTKGGISMLSGYVDQVRNSKPNVLYCIAGDMLQGSLIDTEFKGLSTMDIMNLLYPDVVSLGNHETDYGITHLLFLEKCARFPIVSANFFIKQPYTRLFKPYTIIKRGDMKIMFIGIITKEVMDGIKNDSLYSPLIDVEDAAREVGNICNAYRTTDIDLTVLLTHIGFEEDKELAHLLDPRWGVDIIIGGHSHTVLEQPVTQNGILITQAGVGTNQIGRFDLEVNLDTNSVENWKWELIPIDKEHCPRNLAIDDLLSHYTNITDEKYSRVLCRLPRELTHPCRYQETELGSLMADVHRACFKVDISLVGSGSVRKDSSGPILTLGDITEIMPYHGDVYQYKITGAALKKILRHILREEVFVKKETEFFQFSKGIRIVWSRKHQDFEALEFEEHPVEDDRIYSLTLQEYHKNNCSTSMGIPFEELVATAPEVCVSTDEQDTIVEYLSSHPVLRVPVKDRLVVSE